MQLLLLTAAVASCKYMSRPCSTGFILQAVWSQLWQIMIALLGISMILLAFEKDKSKLPRYSQEQQQTASDASHPGKLQ